MAQPYRYEKNHTQKKHDIVFFFKIEIVILLFVIFCNLILDLKKPSQFSSKATLVQKPQTASVVLGEQTVQTLIVSPAPTVIPAPTLAPTITQSIGETGPAPVITKKKSYSIAVYGDSMVDTMGERLEYVEHALTKKYPQTTFYLYNYGIGAQNAEDGLSRLASKFDNRDRHYQALQELRPDIIIVGSFAYNPFSPYNRDRHWLALTRLVQEAQKISPTVYMMAEIAPLRKDFGKGPNGVNWEENTVYQHSEHIIEQLENAVGLSKTLHVPLIDAFTPTKDNTNEEEKKYVNPSDGIHPSVTGHEFTADVIVETLKLE